jgi:hypothetical protein
MSSDKGPSDVITIPSDDDTAGSDNVVIVYHPQRVFPKKEKVATKVTKIVKIKIEKIAPTISTKTPEEEREELDDYEAYMVSIGKKIEDKPITQTKPLPWSIQEPVIHQKPFIVDLINYATINKEVVHGLLLDKDVFNGNYQEAYGKFEKKHIGIELDVNKVIRTYYNCSTQLLELVEKSLDYCRQIWISKPHYSDCFTYPWCSLLFSIKRMIVRNYYCTDHIMHLIELIPRFKNIVEELPSKFMLINELLHTVKETIKIARDNDDTVQPVWEV